MDYFFILVNNSTTCILYITIVPLISPTCKPVDQQNNIVSDSVLVNNETFPAEAYRTVVNGLKPLTVYRSVGDFAILFIIFLYEKGKTS